MLFNSHSYFTGPDHKLHNIYSRTPVRQRSVQYEGLKYGIVVVACAGLDKARWGNWVGPSQSSSFKGSLSYFSLFGRHLNRLGDLIILAPNVDPKKSKVPKKVSKNSQKSFKKVQSPQKKRVKKSIEKVQKSPQKSPEKKKKNKE